MTFRFFLVSLIFLLSSSELVHAQSPVKPSTGPVAPPNSITSEADVQGSRTDPRSLGSPEAEIRIKHEIHLAEKARRDNIERAREIEQISGQLQTSFKRTESLDKSDLKKLDRMERLIKRLRSSAGGAGDESPLEETPNDPKTALQKLVDSAEKIRRQLEKTPRMVVSASLIERANQLLALTRHVRSYIR